jgi:hypothetical protein
MKSKILGLSLALTIALVVAAPASAQYAALTWGPFNTSLPPSNTNGSLGVSYDHLNNYYLASSRGTGASNVAPHSVEQYDVNGNYIGFFPQIPGGAWGYRDGDTDFAAGGLEILFGMEFGIYVIDNTGALAPFIMTGNGASLVGSANFPANPITGPGLTTVGLYRALAYNPNGNNGNGSCWSASFGTSLIEIDLAGNILTVHPNITPLWSLYGLAMDPMTGNLWGNSAPNQGNIVEIDVNTGLQTGAKISHYGGLMGYPATGGTATAQGGLHGMVNHAATGAYFDLICLQQGAPDAIGGYRVHEVAARNGTMEARFVTGVNGAIPDDVPAKTWSIATNLEFGYDTTPDPLQATQPGIYGLNIGFPGTNLDAVTLGAPEYRLAHNFSAPAGAAIYLGDGMTGGLLPSLLGSYFGFGPHLLGDPNFILFSPAPAIFIGQELRFQGLYIDLITNALVCTNQVRVLGAP